MTSLMTSYSIKFVLFYALFLKFVHIHSEDIEVNISLKVADTEQSSNASSSKIFDILIRYKQNNLIILGPNNALTNMSVITSKPLTSSETITTTTATETTLQSNFSDPWSSNATDHLSNTTEVSPWTSDTADSWLIDYSTELPVEETTDNDVWSTTMLTTTATIATTATTYPVGNANFSDSWWLECWFRATNNIPMVLSTVG